MWTIWFQALVASSVELGVIFYVTLKSWIEFVFKSWAWRVSIELWSWNWIGSVQSSIKNIYENIYKNMSLSSIKTCVSFWFLICQGLHTPSPVYFFFPLFSSTWLLSVWKTILVNCWHFPSLISLPLLFDCALLAFWPFSVIQCWQHNFAHI